MAADQDIFYWLPYNLVETGYAKHGWLSKSLFLKNQTRHTRFYVSFVLLNYILFLFVVHYFFFVDNYDNQPI